MCDLDGPGNCVFLSRRASQICRVVEVSAWRLRPTVRFLFPPFRRTSFTNRIFLNGGVKRSSNEQPPIFLLPRRRLRAIQIESYTWPHVTYPILAGDKIKAK